MRTARGQGYINNFSKSKHTATSSQPGSDKSGPSPQLNLSRFSEEERQAILSVVKRDLEVRCREKYRLKKLRNDLLQQDTRAPLSLPGTTNSCAICRGQFIIFLNRRLTCSLCRREVCRNCSKPYDGEMLCTICSRDIFYRAMVCHWFYDNSPGKACGHASDAVVKSLFKNRLPEKSELTEEQLHQTVSSYLGPERETYVNGVVITPQVVQRLQNDQIRAFTKRYEEIRSASLAALHQIKTTAIKNGERDVEEEIERITSQFLKQTREALRKLLQMLCITEEKYNLSLGNAKQGNTSVRVLEVTQKQVEQIVGHKIKIPGDYDKSEVDEDFESYVASVTGGPEEFFANILLEDLKNGMQISQSSGTIQRALATK